MRIKQITIQGFKSYKDQIVIEPFSPGLNVVVGRNGSGKSNFFSAIRFVLNDAYSKMGQEERQTLLHEGLNTLGSTTFVEIIFDNVDHRFPTGKDEVALKRAIGLKKDEYYLDQKSAPKTDIMNLLQSAGFSKSNPYYIVPQGRITALTNARDIDRLQLLKEVAGTRVYEEHREESLKIISETQQKRSSIEELLLSINEKIESLEEEKSELVAYTNLDRDKRSLEYNLAYREQLDIDNAIQALDETYKTELSDSSHQRKISVMKQNDILRLDSLIRQSKQELDILNNELVHLNDDKIELLRDKSRKQMRLNDMRSEDAKNACLEQSLLQELHNINSDIALKESKLKDLDSLIKTKELEESKLQTDLSCKQSQHETLMQKQNRSSQFNSAEERDASLKKEIESLTSSIVYEKEKIFSVQSDIEHINTDIKSLEMEKLDLSKKKEKIMDDIEALDIQCDNLNRTRERLSETRKQLWREEAKIDSILPSVQNELLKLERQIYGTLDKGTSAGLESVRRICQLYRIEGVHGPVYELFDVDDIYASAVEIIAGTSLFHVVVDNDRIATQILEVLIKEKSGRVTFVPLNRVRPKETVYPSNEELSNQAIPMINILRFDDRYSMILKQIFGKAIIVPDLTTGSAIAKSHNLNAITLEGDRVDYKGILTGGFIEHKSSRLFCAKQVKIFQAKSGTFENRLSALKFELSKLDQEVAQINGEISIQENLKKKLKNEIESTKFQLSNNSSLLSEKTALLSERERALREYQLEMDKCQIKIDCLANEIGTKLNLRLSKDQSSMLADLKREIENLQNALQKLDNEKMVFLLESQGLINALNDFLKKRQDETKDLISDLQSKINEDARKDLEDSNEHMENLLIDLSQKEKAISSEKTSLTKKIEESSKMFEKLTSEHSEESKTNGEENYLMKYMSKKSGLEKKKDDCLRKIRELGLIPEDALTNFQELPTSQLAKKLHSVTDRLKAYAHVNKKAAEQYGLFTGDRSALLQRKKELDNSAQAIVEFIENLDTQKDEAVQRTFDQVSQYFSEIFKQLVPNGQAELDMMRSIESDGTVPTRSSELSQPANSGSIQVPVAVSQYTGVSIQVSFNAKTQKRMRMQQLSGGQKSLLSLALIFAIQKCDPAPFYLFDEIDANLDATHRTSVAKMIHSLSKSAQFIITTFRPEMLSFADKFYGVTFSNRVSRIQRISKEAAIEFIEDQNENLPPANVRSPHPSNVIKDSQGMQESYDGEDHSSMDMDE